MSAKLKCPICGQLFDGCRSCEKHNLASWKTLTDTENHFNIYVILHKYNVLKKITKEQARELLLKCDLTGYENFQKHISEMLKDILKKEIIIEPEVVEEIIDEEIKSPIEEENKPIKQNKYNKKNTKK